MEFTIRTSWDGKPLEEADHVTIFIGPQDKGLELRIDAPFYNDPPAPSGPGGQAFPQVRLNGMPLDGATHYFPTMH